MTKRLDEIREALYRVLIPQVRDLAKRAPAGIDQGSIAGVAWEFADAIVRSDAVDGDRVARWADKKAEQARGRANNTDRMSQHKRDELVGEARAYSACARIARTGGAS